MCNIDEYIQILQLKESLNTKCHNQQIYHHHLANKELGVGPLDDLFQSHTSRSLFNGLLWFFSAFWSVVIHYPR